MSKKNETKYYNPDIILSKKDLNKEEPSIYIVTTNRSAGKTTAWLKYLLEQFKKDKSQCVLLFRYRYELSDAYKLFEDILNIFPELSGEMKTECVARGLMYKLIYNDEQLGYAVALSNVDSIKKYSPLFAKVKNVFMDEYQTENGKYLTHEVQKMISILQTITRGGGEQSRKIKLILCGNLVTLMNPYLIEFGIYKRVKKDTKFLRGDGWVAEFGFNESASNSIKSNNLFNGFKNNDYMNYSTENNYLYDSNTFLDKPKGKCKYICTIIQDGVKLGVRSYWEQGIVLVNKKFDDNNLYKVTFKANDHNQNTVMLNHYSFLWKNIRDAYQQGLLRFDDVKTKEIIFDILAVDLYK